MPREDVLDSVSFRPVDYRFVRGDGLAVRGEQRAGNLDLFYELVRGSVSFRDSTLSGALRAHPDGMLVDGAVNLADSQLGGVRAEGLVTRHDLYAADAALGDLAAAGSIIGRDVNLSGGDVDSIDLEDASINRYLNGRDGDFGRVDAAGASVEHAVDLRGAAVGDDVVLRDADVRHGVYLDSDVDGVVDLRGASMDALYVDDLGAYDVRWDEETVIGAVYGLDA